jgi:hypothetical protein
MGETELRALSSGLSVRRPFSPLAPFSGGSPLTYPKLTMMGTENDIRAVKDDEVGQLEQSMRSMRRRLPDGTSYLGSDESYRDLIRRDGIEVKRLGSSHLALAQWLVDLSQAIEQQQQPSVFHFAGQDFVAAAIPGTRYKLCPFGDQFRWNTIYKVINLTTFKPFWFSAGHIHMISTYGFYGGESSRLSPEEIFAMMTY